MGTCCHFIYIWYLLDFSPLYVPELFSASQVCPLYYKCNFCCIGFTPLRLITVLLNYLAISPFSKISLFIVNSWGYIYIYLNLHRCIHPICLFLSLSSIYLSLSIYPSIYHLSISISIIYLSIYVSIISIYPSIYPFSFLIRKFYF